MTTVFDELKNRGNCRYRLRGVLVSVDGTEPAVPVAHTYWEANSQLMVALENGLKVPAERCHLRSQWPIACCTPRRHNQWNSVGRKWYTGLEQKALTWGDWAFDEKELTLTHPAVGYEIDLKRIHSSAAILDWIFQIRRKPWADARAMHDLLNAFAEILDPQANYCPWEENRKADGGKLGRKFAKRRRA
jgi:hypothetical protein